MTKKQTTKTRETTPAERFSVKDARFAPGLPVKTGLRAGIEAGRAGTSGVQMSTSTEETRT